VGVGTSVACPREGGTLRHFRSEQANTREVTSGDTGDTGCLYPFGDTAGVGAWEDEIRFLTSSGPLSLNFAALLTRSTPARGGRR
jgi:hypothetical protein